jgi:hypothetical protein
MGWIEDNTNFDSKAKIGMRIRIIQMEDDHGVDEGMEGTILTIDDLGTLHVRWDDGSQLGVIPGIDKYELLEDEYIDDPDKFVNMFGEGKSGPMTTNLKKDFKTFTQKNKVKVKVESEEIEGGKAQKMSVNDLAKKHSVSVEEIKKELEVGLKIELEHTKSKEIAKEIAMDHIAEFPDYYTNKKYGVKASEKGLEKIHENKMSITDDVKRILDTIKTAKPIHRTSLDNMVNNLINKYKNVKKDEEKFRELIQNLKNKISDKFDIDETTMSGSAGAYVGPISTKIEEATSTKNTDFTTGVDGKIWADKNGDGWNWNDKPVWSSGEIIDLLAKIPATWDDDNLDISKEWDKTKKTYISEEKTDIEETTTFGSVFGGNFPVTPFAFAKKGKHNPSKKTLWKGGKIIQKIDRFDIMGESILDEINKVKWVKNAKYVKIKDRCAKYNNQPWCSQGAIDNPLEFSNNTFENIKSVSNKTGLSEKYIIEKIVGLMNEDTRHNLSLLDRFKIKMAGIDDNQVIYNLNNNLPIDWKGTKEGYYEKTQPTNLNKGSN